MEGIFGIFSKEECSSSLHKGTFLLQHRGQQYCGLSTSDGKEIKIRTHRGLVGPSFENDLPGLEGFSGIGYTGSETRQPISRHCKQGKFIIAFNGCITNSEELRRELLKKGHSFSGLEDAELIATIISQEKNIADGISLTLEKIKGPCSLILLSKDGIYAARDTMAMRPLVLGEGEDRQMVASESCVFGPDSKIKRDMSPGEIILLNRNGFNVVKRGSEGRKHCSFEWIYYARPDSFIEGISVVRARQNLGKFLAQQDCIEADIVGPVPFSGICHAEGYHLESSLPNLEVFLPPQYFKRTYNMPLEARKKEKNTKLTPLASNVRGKKIILVDDSIRSGITMRGLIDSLKKAGAKEVHVRIASPISIKYCPYERSPLKEENFIASDMNAEEIRKFIKADSLKFQKLEDIPKAIGLPRGSLCLECFV